ncbi:MAG TPA: 16S rRNA (cytosine(967)-C(5))-methyltransferase RsmB [Candidatus Eisenbergiella merdipullorum]|uniref:16S rRNA (cytosine(967)-C(5))-methyltransferase n=1 Tax=Candidatus Eisenbergiella merdipullorum TaxID=2838553 RepID=A0A9D2L111_9FIRM|nr:16S rRNA (cytosine(967)-C(5))-methyltransferase RsmB [Candidatus Eisenbergiella merdipullorum]
MDMRALALDLLLEEERGTEYESRLLKSALDKYDYLDGRDKAFLKRLVDGVTERRLQLDYVLEQFSSLPVRKMKPLIRCVLRMGAYQILFMESVPDSAACNEAVKLVKKRRFAQLSGFVNGVLRKLCAQKDTVVWPDRQNEPLDYLSVRYSMPEWIVRKWAGEYGMERTETMLAALLEKRPLTIRLSERLSEKERESLLGRLKERGCDPVPHPLFSRIWEKTVQDGTERGSFVYMLKGAEGVASLPGFTEGAFAVQDAASMLAVECSGLRNLIRLYQTEESKDLFVLDVCAAPGGKACQAAELLDDKGTVLARDLTENKVSYIEENAARLRLSNLRTQVWDARTPDRSLWEKADVVLADLPCSGLGVMGRKADIRYRVSPESLSEVADLQRKILSVIWQYVKPGGLLIYSTCTLNREENEDMAAWFLGQFPFKPQEPAIHLPENCRDGEPQGCVRLLPGENGTDGFFIACLRRKS